VSKFTPTYLLKQLNKLLHQDNDRYDVFDFRVGTLVGTLALCCITPINTYFNDEIPDLPMLRHLQIVVQILSIVGSYWFIFIKKWGNEIGNAFSITYALQFIFDLYQDGFPNQPTAMGIVMLFALMGMFKTKKGLQIYWLLILSCYLLAVWTTPVIDVSRGFLTFTTLIFFVIGYYAFAVKLDILKTLGNREREIEQSEVMFRGIFDSVPVGIVMLDTEFMSVRYNQYFQKIIGYTEGELDSMGMDKIIHPDDFLSRETLAIAKDNTFATEQRLFTKSGETLLMNVQITPLMVNGGSFRIAMYNDITAERQTQKDLELSAKALREHNEALEEFSYVISHDLQEPLRMITSFTQIVQRRYLKQINDENANYDFNFVIDGAKRMSTLIRDMLEYSRWSARALPLIAVDLNETLREAKLNLKISIDKSQPIIEAGVLPTIAANRHMAVQVFQNLIGNSIKYRHPERTPHIQITVEMVDEEWLFTFKDNGIGFEPQYKERIFGIFQRLQTDRSTGNGIGLAICKRTVERQSGRIWTESTLGQGATFYFTLPFKDLKDLDTEGIDEKMERIGTTVDWR
jgi:PAS domain S-box-containing protein